MTPSKKQTPSLLLLIHLLIVGGACGPQQHEPALIESVTTNEACFNTNVPAQEIFLPVEGDLTQARTWKARGTPNPSQGLVFVSGVDGGLIEPADNIYSRIANRYAHLGVSSVFVKYRQPGELEPSVADATAAVNHLKEQGVKQIAIFGWSFGGAVITHTTVRHNEIATAIGFSPQALDTEPVSEFRNQSLLLFHSEADENVPYESSQQILDEAPAGLHKELVTLLDTDHLLTGQGDHIAPIVYHWLNQTLHVSSHCSE